MNLKEWLASLALWMTKMEMTDERQSARHRMRMARWNRVLNRKAHTGRGRIIRSVNSKITPSATPRGSEP